ncbi:MAG: hypothetical protein J0M28_18700 [Thauera sp.]|nr:hypothetical protein [Thauera sp.]
MENIVMNIGKLLHTITRGRGKTQPTARELALLAAENRMLRNAVAEANAALADAPLWHMQHRVARNILADAADEVVQFEEAVAQQRRLAVRAARVSKTAVPAFNRTVGADC